MDGEWLAQRFEADRARLQAVAYRMLGSTIAMLNDTCGNLIQITQLARW